MIKEPELSEVPPVNVLAPASVKAPLPICFSAPEPEITPPKVVLSGRSND